MTKSITRSLGVPTGHLGTVAGGGRSGITTDLDSEVARAAEALRGEYDADTTIRFNSNRMSGGAWLVNSEDDRIGANSDIGITVRMVDVADLRAARARYPLLDTVEQQLAEDGIDPNNPPDTYLRVSAYIGTAALLHPDVATDMIDNPQMRYAHVAVASIEAALDLLRDRAIRPDAAPTPRRP